MPPWKPPAGGAGKGFAVVAAEVRSLAQKSGTAAREIKELIETSNQRVAEGVRHVERAGDAMLDIETSVKQVTQIVNEIAAISSEQHRHRQRQPHHFRDRHRGAAQRGAGGTGQPGGRNLHARHCAMPSRCSGLPAQGAMPRRPVAQAEPLRRAGRFRCWNDNCPENRREPSPRPLPTLFTPERDMQANAATELRDWIGQIESALGVIISATDEGAFSCIRAATAPS